MWKPRLREAKGWARPPSQERSVPSPQSKLRLRQDTATLPERLKQAAKGAGVGGSRVGSRHPGADWARGAHDLLPNTNQGGQGAGAEGGAGWAEGGASCPGGPPAGWSGRCAAWEFIWGASRGGRHGRGWPGHSQLPCSVLRAVGESRSLCASWASTPRKKPPAWHHTDASGRGRLLLLGLKGKRPLAEREGLSPSPGVRRPLPGQAGQQVLRDVPQGQPPPAEAAHWPDPAAGVPGRVDVRGWRGTARAVTDAWRLPCAPWAPTRPRAGPSAHAHARLAAAPSPRPSWMPP